MAVLEKIRSRASILVIAIGLALLAFLFGDFFQGCSALHQDKQMNAFTINGEAVKIHEYDRRVQQVAESYRAQGQDNLTDADMQMIRNQVYAGMVAETILKEEAEKIGVVVSPAETWDLTQGENISPIILQDPAFRDPQSGLFNRVGLVNFLKEISSSTNLPAEQQAQMEQAKSYWLNLEQNVRRQKLEEKYSAIVAKAIVSNKLELDKLVQAESTMSDLLYVRQRLNDVPTLQVEVSDSDLKDYYDAHVAYFRTEDAVQVDVVYATIRPTEQDYADTRTAIENAQKELQEGIDPAIVLNEYSDASYPNLYLTKKDFNPQYFPEGFLAFLDVAQVGEVSDVFTTPDYFSVAKMVAKKRAPENRKVRHIVLMPAGTFDGQINGDSLLTVLKGDPSLFAAAAKAHSLDRNSSDAGGEIGTLTEAMATQYIDAAFSDAIFGASLNVPFKYVSKYGEHIILVEEQGEMVDKYKVAYANKQVVPSTTTQASVYAAMNDFLTQLPKGAEVDSMAVNAGFQTISDLIVSGSQPQIAQNIEESRSLIYWAMGQNPGAVSDVTECGDKYVLVKVLEKIPAGQMPLNLVRNMISPVVENDKKVEKMYGDLVAANYSSLQAFADSFGGVVDTLQYVKYSTGRLADIGAVPEINAVATFAKVGELEPVKSTSAVYLTQVLTRSPEVNVPTVAGEQLKLNANRRGFVRGQLMNELINKAELEDRRYTFQ